MDMGVHIPLISVTDGIVPISRALRVDENSIQWNFIGYLLANKARLDGLAAIMVASRFSMVQLTRHVVVHPATLTHVLPGNVVLAGWPSRC